MCFPLMGSFLLREGEEAVAVVLVLLATSLDLGGEAGGQIVDEKIELVQKVNNFALLIDRWSRNEGLAHDFRIEVSYRSRACALRESVLNGG